MSTTTTHTGRVYPDGFGGWVAETTVGGGIIVAASTHPTREAAEAAIAARRGR